tara:strand:- start:2230 stop:2841 length:612 start_codon:yes stop_codon:yes gene_type:complete
MYKYPIIVFEGIEASGKSEQIKNVIKYLKNIRRKFIKIREPGGSKYSENIRNLILNKKSKLNYKTDLLLILASRSENIDKIIRKFYKKKIILIDRFTDSTIAYQHFGMGINVNLIKKINNFVIENYKPDFTFLNIVNQSNMRKRLKLRVNKNKYDYFGKNFYRKVQNGFLKISKNKKKYMIINSNNDINKNKSIILKKVINLI